MYVFDNFKGLPDIAWVGKHSQNTNFLLSVKQGSIPVSFGNLLE